MRCEGLLSRLADGSEVREGLLGEGRGEVRVSHFAEPLTRLTRAQDQMRQFWRCTKYANDPLLFVEVLATFEPAPAVPVRQSLGCKEGSSMLWHLSPLSGVAAWASLSQSGGTAAAALEAWRASNGGQTIVQPGDMSIRFAWSMPAAHAMLVASGTMS